MSKIIGKIAFIDRRKKIKSKCVWCGKMIELFGWIRDPITNKEGLACEGCIRSKFFSEC